jgi:hypothetical protein
MREEDGSKISTYYETSNELCGDHPELNRFYEKERTWVLWHPRDKVGVAIPASTIRSPPKTPAGFTIRIKMPRIERIIM